MAEDMGARRLIWTILENCCCNDDENVEEDTKRSDADDNGRDCDVDLPKITREGTTEKQQGNLQHQWQ